MVLSLPFVVGITLSLTISFSMAWLLFQYTSLRPGIKKQVFPVEKLLNAHSLKYAIIALLFLPFKYLTLGDFQDKM